MTYTPHCVIGLTGNLGSGKSTVAHIAEGLGARIIDSDRTVHNLLACDTDLALEIENEFGSSVMRNGWPDRSSLAQVVFNDAAALRQLEDLIFPRVARQTNKQLAQPTRSPATLIEAIKVIEGPTGKLLDALWLVVSTVDLQVSRATTSGRISEDEAKRRLAVQSDTAEKERLFKIVRPGRPIWKIDNRSSEADLVKRVAETWKQTLRVVHQPESSVS